MRFITDWEWTPISLSALGIGMALIWFLEYYFVGRNKPKPVSLESQSSSFLQKLISKVEKPFDSTTMVTRKSDWEQVLKELMKYTNNKLKICTFLNIINFSGTWKLCLYLGLTVNGTTSIISIERLGQ